MKEYANSETWSADRIKELTMNKIHSRSYNAAGSRSITMPRRTFPRFAAIVAVVTLLLATTALAATGVLDNIFATFKSGTVNGGLGNDSRKAIIANDFVETLKEPISGGVLTLNSYYADERELGFDFTLIDANIEGGFYDVFIPECVLEITGADGSTSTWVDGSTDMLMLVDAAAVKTEKGMNVSVIVKFHNGKVPVGERAKLSINGINFRYALPDDQLLSAADKIIEVDGQWKFEVDIADKFVKTEELVYKAETQEGFEGITIKSVSVLPTVCRIEAEIDYTKNTLANPANVNNVSEPKYLPKLNVMDTDIYATDANGKVYRLQSSSYYPDEPLGGATKCWFEIDSMYFDAPSELGLTFTGLDGATIDIMLTLSK